MTKVRTDIDLIEKFLERGTENIYPSKDALRQKLLSGERIKAYQGYDPTGPHLHVGHAMGIRALRILQQLGHEVIFLVGDFTSKVGDPDKDTARRMLTDVEIENNMNGWKDQASQLIDFEGENPVLFKRNYEWLSKIGLSDLIKLMSCSTVQQMIERDMFQKRLSKNDPIGLHEFIYPLMQGFDSVAMDVDLEVGGNDQTFNMLMGRELVKKYLGKEKFVRTNEMMEAPDARTMSKTKGNGINLNDEPFDMYGKAMSYPDELITKALRLLTDVSMEDIYNIEKQMQAGENPMLFKKLLAFEITKLIKGEKEAFKAEELFRKTIQEKTIDEDIIETIEISDNILSQGNIPLIDFLKISLDGKRSSSEIKRVIEQGGVEVNKQKVIEPNTPVKLDKDTLVKYGKRKFFKIK